MVLKSGNRASHVQRNFPSEPPPTAGFAAPNLSCAGEAVPKELQDSGDVNPEL